MIKFKCGKCDHQYQVPENYAGRKVRCKSCKAACVIPKPKKDECGDSLARYNKLLQELQEYEKTAPAIEIDSN